MKALEEPNIDFFYKSDNDRNISAKIKGEAKFMVEIKEEDKIVEVEAFTTSITVIANLVG